MTADTTVETGSTTRRSEQANADTGASGPDTDRSAPGKAGWSVGRLFADLTQQAARLIREEVALATAEISRSVGQLGRGVGLIAAGGLVAYAGFLVLLAAAVLGLGKLVEPWLAALVVGGAVVAIGAGVAWYGKRQLRADHLTPHRTLKTLKEDRAWVVQQTR